MPHQTHEKQRIYFINVLGEVSGSSEAGAPLALATMVILGHARERVFSCKREQAIGNRNSGDCRGSVTLSELELTGIVVILEYILDQMPSIPSLAVNKILQTLAS